MTLQWCCSGRYYSHEDRSDEMAGKTDQNRHKKVLNSIQDLKAHFQREFDILKDTSKQFQDKFVKHEAWMTQKDEEDREKVEEDNVRDEKLETLQNEVKDLKDSNKTLKWHILKVEGQSRRDNRI